MNNEQESKNNSDQTKGSKEKTSGFLITDEDEEENEEPGLKIFIRKSFHILLEFSQIK